VFPSPLRPILLVLAAMVLALGVMSPVQAAPPTDGPGGNVGPSWPYVTILNGQFTLIPLKNQAMISETEHGYRVRAGQQDSRLVVTQVEGGLRFHDSGTREWKSIPDACQREQAVGVAAVCPVPSSIGPDNPMLLEVWPRLGDDFVDGSTLPEQFQMAVLADAGVDTVLTGAGHDFVNGAMQVDVVQGGAGNDWIRVGDANDDIAGGPGDDKLVGSDGADIVRGGNGTDRVDGGAGDDRLYADDSSVDVVACGSGSDTAQVDMTDKARDCETVSRL